MGGDLVQSADELLARIESFGHYWEAYIDVETSERALKVFDLQGSNPREVKRGTLREAARWMLDLLESEDPCA